MAQGSHKISPWIPKATILALAFATSCAFAYGMFWAGRQGIARAIFQSHLHLHASFLRELSRAERGELEASRDPAIPGQRALREMRRQYPAYRIEVVSSELQVATEERAHFLRASRDSEAVSVALGDFAVSYFAIPGLGGSFIVRSDTKAEQAAWSEFCVWTSAMLFCLLSLFGWNRLPPHVISGADREQALLAQERRVREISAGIAELLREIEAVVGDLPKVLERVATDAVVLDSRSVNGIEELIGKLRTIALNQNLYFKSSRESPVAVNLAFAEINELACEVASLLAKLEKKPVPSKDIDWLNRRIKAVGELASKVTDSKAA